jgi:hypothetical protein
MSLCLEGKFRCVLEGWEMMTVVLIEGSSDLCL